MTINCLTIPFGIWFLIQFILLFNDLLLEIVLKLSRQYKDCPVNPGMSNTVTDVILFHGLCRSKDDMVLLQNYIQNTLQLKVQNIGLPYHEDHFGGVSEVDSVELERQMLEKIQSILQYSQQICIIAHSFSATVLMKLSLEGRLPDGLGLVFICPAIQLRHTMVLKIILRLFYFKYLIIPRNFGIMIFDIVKLGCKLLLKFDINTIQRSIDHIINSYPFFSRAGIVEVIKIEENILNLLSNNYDIQHEHIVILGRKDIFVNSDKINELLKNGQKNYGITVIHDTGHNPHLSRQKAVQNRLYDAICAFIKANFK